MSNNNSNKKTIVTIVAIVVILTLFLCCAGGGIGTFFVYKTLEKDLGKKTVDITEVPNEPDRVDENVVELLDSDRLTIKSDLSDMKIVTEDNEKKVVFKVDAVNSGEEALMVELCDIVVNNEEMPINISIDVIELGSGTEYDGKAEYTYGEEIEIFLDSEYLDKEVESIKFRFELHELESLDKMGESSYCELEFTNESSAIIMETAEINEKDLTLVDASEKEDAEEEDAEEEDDSNIVEDDDTSEVKQYGTDKVGYVTLDGVWANFDDVDIANSEHGDMVQYSNGDVIVTLNVVKDGDPKKNIEYLASMKEDAGTKVTTGKYDTSLMDAQYIYEEYEDGYKLYITCFTSNATKNDGDMIYLAIESPLQSKDEFIETVNNIQDTHSYGYFYESFSLDNTDL